MPLFSSHDGHRWKIEAQPRALKTSRSMDLLKRTEGRTSDGRKSAFFGLFRSTSLAKSKRSSGPLPILAKLAPISQPEDLSRVGSNEGMNDEGATVSVKMDELSKTVLTRVVTLEKITRDLVINGVQQEQQARLEHVQQVEARACIHLFIVNCVDQGCSRRMDRVDASTRPRD
jgi:hypothetical protein